MMASAVTSAPMGQPTILTTSNVQPTDVDRVSVDDLYVHPFIVLTSFQ
jgi:hypothetical protein